MLNFVDCSKIKIITSLKAIKPFIISAGQDPLIIFDIDDVLIMPTPNHYLKHPYRNNLWHNIQQRSSREQIRLLKFKIMQTTRYRLVDPYIMNILKYLKKYAIPTIALTSLSTGKVDDHNTIEELRIKNLNRLGISFKKLTPMTGEALANSLTGKNMIFSECIGTPMIKSGIIFTAGVDKSIVLNYMFNKYNYHPKTILFIDDDLKNLELVKNLCNKLQINFQGFHYIFVSKMPLDSIDRNFEEFRFKNLENNYVWLENSRIDQYNSLC